jgi:hypothetical protein
VTGARGKPLVYLAIVLPMLVGGGLAVMLGLERVFAMSRGIPLAAIPQRNGMLIALPAFFLWIPLALLLANLVVQAISPMRRVAEQYQRRTGTPDFGESQRELGRFAIGTAVLAIPLIALGFWI